MNGLRIFSNESFGEVRVAEVGGSPVFCLADVCKVLGLGNPSQVKSRLDDGVISNEVMLDVLGRPQEMAFVNEDGLYDVILDSRKPIAKQFRKWVTSEVLPSIRRDGGYMVVKEEDTGQDIMARALLIAQETLKRREERIAQLEQKAVIDAPKVDFYDQVVDSKDAIDMLSVAKVLNMGIGRNKLFKFLRDYGVLMGDNRPYQDYVDRNWFRCIETKFTLPSGDVKIYIKTMVLQKGLDGIRKLLTKHYEND